jgi:hypothetical protein
MVITTERDRELIANFAAHGAGLGKLQVMRVGRRAPADKAGLRSNKSEVRFTSTAQGPRWYDAYLSLKLIGALGYRLCA